MTETFAVIGPSGAGKSTFIARRYAALHAPAPILAHELDQIEAMKAREERRVVHLNMLHPFGNSWDLGHSSLPVTALLRKLPQEGLRAAILVCRRELLMKRALLRRMIELSASSCQPYNSRRFFEIYCRIDLVALYHLWIDALEELEVPYEIIVSEGSNERRLRSSDELFNFLTTPEEIEYTHAEAAEALSRIPSSYQDLQGILPFGDFGQAPYRRDATFDLIAPQIAASHSLLDIGCGQGYFCFKARQLGVPRVVGTDLKADRYLTACAINQVSRAGAIFRNDDLLFDTRLDETFATVLLLNVIHHLRNPFAGLLAAFSYATEQVILEYPTLADPKFMSTIGKVPSDDLPLIGVSLTEECDQTFVFSDASLERFLVHNEKVCEAVSFADSPFGQARRIAICRKAPGKST